MSCSPAGNRLSIYRSDVFTNLLHCAVSSFIETGNTNSRNGGIDTMSYFRNTCIVVLLLITGIQFTYAAKVSGVVFEDTNQNLELDPGERGVPNVIVSNQQDVVLTDHQGRYVLPVHDEMIVFITKPSGYSTPLDEHNLPQFYYIHQPQGSPDLKYPGVRPTGPLPESVDFPLFRASEPDTFQAIVLSDPQPRNQQEINYIRDDVVAELVGTEAAFGITLGDVMFDNLSLYQRQNAIFSAIGIPFYNVPGNHDMNYYAPDDHYSLETFKSIFGPPYYAFEYGKVHFIVLDDIVWNNPPDEDGYYIEKLGREQLTWLEEHLKHVPEDRLLVLSAHAPFVALDSVEVKINIEDGRELFRILQGREKALMLAGHYHLLERILVDRDLGWQGEQPIEHITCSAVSGSWWLGSKDERGIPVADQRDGTPNGYHIFSFRGTDYSQRFKPANRDDDFQIRISVPKGVLARHDLSTSRIIANVFNATPRWQIEYQWDDSGFRPMHRVLTRDPYVRQLYTEDSLFAMPWLKPQNSLHLWEAPMPDHAPLGVHKIVVHARDGQGRQFEAARIIEIVADGEVTVLDGDHSEED